jgi:hypothetical protein
VAQVAVAWLAVDIDAAVMELPVALAALAGEQCGVVTRRQLAAHGVSVGQVRWRLGRTWRQLLPGVVLLSPALPTLDQRRVAAQLYGGPRSWLAGPTAAALYGFLREHAEPRIHVFVPPTAKPGTVNWVTVRRTHLVDERLVERGPLTLSCRARAVVDAAAVLPDSAARALVIDVVHRRLVRLDDLTHWVEARQTRGRLWLRQALRGAAAGSWSVPEADLAALLRSSTVLPRAMLNPELKDMQERRLTTPDVWFDDVGMAVMVHSREFHAGALQWDATVTDDSDLSSYRIVVVGVTPEQLARDPRSVLRRVESRYLVARAWGFRPAVIATPRLRFRHSA